MEFAYCPEIWRDLFGMAGLASAALTGLLSIGLSLNLRSIVGSPMHLARAREAFIALTVLLMVSIFVLIPGQGRVALGVELLVLSIVVAVVSGRLQAQTLRRMPERQRRAWRRRLLILNSAVLAIAFAGGSLVSGRLGGLLWLLPTILIFLVWSTYNAWSLAVGPAYESDRSGPVA